MCNGWVYRRVFKVFSVRQHFYRHIFNDFQIALAKTAVGKTALGEGFLSAITLHVTPDMRTSSALCRLSCWSHLCDDDSLTACKDGSICCVVRVASRRQFVCNDNLNFSISIHIFSLLLVILPPPSLPWTLMQSQSSKKYIVNYCNKETCSATTYVTNYAVQTTET